MTTVVSILFNDIIPLRNRGSWQGYINLVWATGASTGAPLGGLLADSIGWRWLVRPSQFLISSPNIWQGFLRSRSSMFPCHTGCSLRGRLA